MNRKLSNLIIKFYLAVFILIFIGMICSSSKKEENKDTNNNDNYKSKPDTVYSKYIVFQNETQRVLEKSKQSGYRDIYINGQEVICILLNDINDDKASEIAQFYKNYYQKWAESNKNFATLQLHFFTKELPNKEWYSNHYDFEKLSDKQWNQYCKCLYGQIIYIYGSDNDNSSGWDIGSRNKVSSPQVFNRGKELINSK